MIRRDGTANKDAPPAEPKGTLLASNRGNSRRNCNGREGAARTIEEGAGVGRGACDVEESGRRFSGEASRNKAARRPAFGMGHARTHSHCAMGYARVLQESEACFSRFSFWILAQGFDAAGCERLGEKREN